MCIKYILYNKFEKNVHTQTYTEQERNNFRYWRKTFSWFCINKHTSMSSTKHINTVG